MGNSSYFQFDDDNKTKYICVWNIIAESGINLEVSEAAFKKSLMKLINTDRL